LLNFCGIDPMLVDFVIDTTPAKQERYIPGTGIVIWSPNVSHVRMDLIDTFLLLAWNYTSEILRNNAQHMTRGGHWIVPIPVPTLI
jgi:C-methyltransferase C-terminal domain